MVSWAGQHRFVGKVYHLAVRAGLPVVETSLAFVTKLVVVARCFSCGCIVEESSLGVINTDGVVMSVGDNT